MTVRSQGVISGSLTWGNREYVEIFDATYKYMYGEVDDLFVAYGTWVEYNVEEASEKHPPNCTKIAVDVDMNVQKSKAPTTDEFTKMSMNVHLFNKVDFFQYDNADELVTKKVLKHKSAIRRDFGSDKYYNEYYGDVNMPRDSRNRLIEHGIDKLDVMMNLTPSSDYKGGPHWLVTHYIHQGKTYSINGYLSIRGFVLRGPGGVVRNRCEVTIPPDALRPKSANSSGRSCQQQFGCAELVLKTPSSGIKPQDDRKVEAEKPVVVNSFGLANRGFTFGTYSATSEASQKPSTVARKPVGLAGFGGSFGSSGGQRANDRAPNAWPRQQQFGCAELVLKTPTPGAASSGTSYGENRPLEPPSSGISSGASSVSFEASSGRSFGGLGGSRPIDMSSSRATTPLPTTQRPLVRVSEASPKMLGFGKPSTTEVPNHQNDNMKEMKNQQELDPFEDVWEDDFPRSAAQRAPRRNLSSGLPPQVKTGLSKFGFSSFRN